MNLASLPLSEREIQELEKLLAIASHQPPEVEDLWKMMDDVWNELGESLKNINVHIFVCGCN